jgi:DNA-binding SARP family transcriptional activator
MVTQVVSPYRSAPCQQGRADRILVCLLGSFRLLDDDRPLDLPIAGKAMTLLSTLALRREAGVPRESLLELLWPEQDAMLAAASLNSLVYSLHRRLREGMLPVTAVTYDNGSYYLNATAGYGTDIARFDALVGRGHQLAAAHMDAQAVLSFERAVALYRGDLCTGSDVYAVIERERLRAAFLGALSWLADYAYGGGDLAAALRHALRILSHDPCREDAHRIVMRARVRQGERAQALRQFRLCERVLREEFDASPERATTELFDRIRTDPNSV